jgi:hypothetical protein
VRRVLSVRLFLKLLPSFFFTKKGIFAAISEAFDLIPNWSIFCRKIGTILLSVWCNFCWPGRNWELGGGEHVEGFCAAFGAPFRWLGFLGELK